MVFGLERKDCLSSADAEAEGTHRTRVVERGGTGRDEARLKRVGTRENVDSSRRQVG